MTLLLCDAGYPRSMLRSRDSDLGTSDSKHGAESQNESPSQGEGPKKIELMKIPWNLFPL